MTHNYNIWLWPGAGYCLDGPWKIKDASCEEHAIELLVTDLIAKENWCYLLKEDEYEKTCREFGYNPDEHGGDDLTIPAKRCGNATKTVLPKWDSDLLRRI